MPGIEIARIKTTIQPVKLAVFSLAKDAELGKLLLSVVE